MRVKPSQSGNPAGRACGSRNKCAIATEKLCFVRNLTLPVRHCERPASARSASYGGFESAEARSAESEGGSEAISLHLRMTCGGDCLVARRAPCNDGGVCGIVRDVCLI